MTSKCRVSFFVFGFLRASQINKLVFNLGDFPRIHTYKILVHVWL